ncbi:MAG: hypothetical protein AAF657_41310 [Acidobacteriota bacterium]
MGRPLHRSIVRRAFPRIVLLACLLTGPTIRAQGAEPAAGEAAAAALALLEYNRELCDGIAGKVMAFWRGLNGSQEAELAGVQDFVVQRELSSLAQGREAADIIDSLLPRVKVADAQVGAALERLQALEVELCDTVAFPNSSRQAFEDEIVRMLDRIEREEAELGQRLVISDAAKQSALSPYLAKIQLAGVEAEGEYRDYLESLKPPPRLPTPQELMEAWHKVYAQAVRPTKQALAKYLKGRRANDTTQIRTACREITAVVIPLLRRDDVFNAPVSKINKPLYQAFVEIRSMASQCVAGRSREVEQHYSEMQAQLATASSTLAEFSLRP